MANEIEGRYDLLFLDNAPSHPTFKLTNVRLAFFNANMTFQFQLMDQGIIQTLEYRQLQLVISVMDKGKYKCGSQLLKDKC